jgi:hypothetical protein
MTSAEGQSLLIKMYESTTETHPRMLMVNALLWLGKITIGIHTIVATDE